MKKCLIVSTVSRQFTLFERGNIEVLKKLGYEIHCVANFNDANAELDELGIIRHHIDIERSPYSFKNIKAYKQLKKIISENKFEIIHCHSPMGSVVTRIAAMKTRKKNNTKVIYTAHGFHFYKGSPIINWLLFYPIEKILSKYTDTLITINNEDYELAKKKMKAKKIEYVPGIGVDENKFNFEITKEEKIKLRKELGLKENDFVMIYTAELNKNKNQIMAINAMKELVKHKKNIHLLLVGKGDLREYYENKVKEYNLESNIHFLGYRNDVPQLLKISDIAISCSKREGLPVNIMESIISSLPCVVTNCRGNRDLIKDGVNGYLVEIDDVSRFITSIEKTFIDKNIMYKYNEIKLGINKIYSLNSIKKIMEMMYSYYSN